MTATIFIRFATFFSATLFILFGGVAVANAATTTDLIVESGMALEAGEYTYDSVVVKTGATLQLKGDPGATSSFKGVRIEATDITIEEGAHITADEQGYEQKQGPGRPTDYFRAGASHGGVGRGNTATSTYGSSVYPTHLGSGASAGSGGGAIVLSVAGTLTVNGTLSADGDYTGSGGSINIFTDIIRGDGIISAQGGSYRRLGSNRLAGGGGRIFIDLISNEFSGEVTARGGRKLGGGYAQSGTVAFYDRGSDILMPIKRFQFDGAYEPFVYKGIVANDIAILVERASDVIVFGDVLLSGNSSMRVTEDSYIAPDNLILKDNAQLTYGSDAISLSVKELRLEDNSVLRGSELTRLQINADEVFVGPAATIDVDELGYDRYSGPGSPDLGTQAGGSYGGKALGQYAKPPYGSKEEPTDFGSAGDYSDQGGGAVSFEVDETFELEGQVRANGGRAASGGSVLIRTGALRGDGMILADGGNYGRTSTYIGAGAGGRIAVYFDNATGWTGTTSAEGGRHATFSGSPVYYAGDGTIVFEEEDPIDPLLLQYAPILQFHEDEDYYPMNVEPFIEASALWQRVGIDTPLFSSSTLTVEEFESFVESGQSTEDHYLAFSDPDNKKSFDLAEAKRIYDDLIDRGDATTTVYVHKMEDGYEDAFGNEHNFIVLQYWFFYAMNNWAEHGGLNNHEGDWESVFVFLDAETKEPEYVAYSQHLNDGFDEPLNIFQYDSVRREWDSSDIQKEGGSATSFVALGSHANYSSNNEGEHVIPVPIADDLIDETSLNGKKVQDNSVLRNLTENFWFDYQGKFGTDVVDFGGESGPYGPNYIGTGGTKRFYNPIGWAGIDNVANTILEPTTEKIDIAKQGIKIKFEEAVDAGTEFSSSLYQEFINFGENVSEINFVPKFWEFDLGLAEGTFNAIVTLSYTDEELEAGNVNEEFITAQYYNEDTDRWEEVTLIDSGDNTITFETDHFSRYSIGAPKLKLIEEGVTAEIRPGVYDQKTDTRDMVLTLTSSSTLPEDMRIVIRDLSQPDAELRDKDGTTISGAPYIDISDIDGTEKEIPLTFELPTYVPVDENADQIAKKPNAIDKKVSFDAELYTQR